MSDIIKTLGAIEASLESASRQRATIFEQLRELGETQARIEGCLPGIKKMLEDHEQRLRVQEASRNRIIGMATAGGGISGVLATVAAWLGLAR